MDGFFGRVYAALRRVPSGRVVSYGQLARLVGEPRKARFVGFAMHGNPEPWNEESKTGIPCHRVVFKDGSLADGFAFGGPGVQRARLEVEGVSFTEDGRVDMDACRWDGRGPAGAAGAGAAPGASAGAPDGPPPDFDWKAELGPDLW